MFPASPRRTTSTTTSAFSATAASRWLVLLQLLLAVTITSGWTTGHWNNGNEIARNGLHKRGGAGVYRWRQQEHHGRVRKGTDVDWTGREPVEECMKIVAEPGRFFYRSGGDAASASACGVYVVAPADQLVRIDFEAVEVTCGSGLVVFFDGWEMNRSVFPNSRDHHLPLKQRSTNMCTKRGHVSRGQRFLSSQNAALIQYRVPDNGEGFAFTVSFIHNPEPCNVLMSAVEGIFTLSSSPLQGPRNCSLTTLLFPANFQVVELKVGGPKEDHTKPETCCSSGGDFVEFGGSSSLDSRKLQAKETACGCDGERIRGNSMTILCESASIRLVSSGRHRNSVSVFARAAAEEDLMGDAAAAMIFCPDFMKKKR